MANSTGLDSIDISGTDRTDGNNDPGYRLTRGATVFDEFAAAGLTEQIGGVTFAHFGLTSVDLGGLFEFPRLWSIGLGHNQIDSVATINNYLLNFNEQEEAVYLNLGDNPISENELAGLNLQNVRHLDIWSMVGAAGPGTSLTNVPLFENPGSRLKDLNMDRNQSITSISNLGDLLSRAPLETLYLGASSITSVDEIMTRRDDGTIAAQNLRRVYLNNIDVPGEPLRGVTALVNLPALEELILRDTTLADETTVRTTFDDSPDIFVEYPDGSTNQPPPPPQE